jgi:hypothetical protein
MRKLQSKRLKAVLLGFFVVVLSGGLVLGGGRTPLSMSSIFFLLIHCVAFYWVYKALTGGNIQVSAIEVSGSNTVGRVLVCILGGALYAVTAFVWYLTNA